MKRKCIFLCAAIPILFGCRMATPYVTYSRLSPDQYEPPPKKRTVILAASNKTEVENGEEKETIQ